MTELLEDDEYSLLYKYTRGNAISATTDQLCTLEHQKHYYAIIDKLLYYTKNCNSRGEHRPTIPQSLQLNLLKESHDDHYLVT